MLAELAGALAARRRERGLSLRDVAEETGVSFNTLSRIERGRAPDLRNYLRVAAWLGPAPAGVRGAVDADLEALRERDGTAGLRATARVLADVLDSGAPAAAKVAASKTLADVLVRLAGGGGGADDPVGRIRGRGPRRRQAAP